MDQYITYEARLASFQKNAKKRGSTASGRGKALNWPHKQIAPASLAKAGFYFDPYPENPDNCVCFLCGKGLDGWEAGDDPLLEHIKHASHCGWAIVTAIELEIDEYHKQDPSLPHMVDARKDTFAGRWPHEGRKGWKCKTKQLVDAGWKYTPTPESDDMATCTYCQLALDGWEPSDKPYDEHYNRSPNCAFFALLAQYGGNKKKTARGKAAQASKASRLSVQSVATAASETTSVADMTAEPEDSVLTTASTMTQGGSKKARGKKATKAKGAKAKTKKTKAAAAAEKDDEDEREDTALAGDESVAQPATKASTSKKRSSEAMEDSVVFLSEAPASKRQATKTRESSRIDSSTITPDDVDLVDVPAPKANARKTSRGSRSSATRKASGAMASSLAPLRAQPEDFPDDDEIERQLEAELERDFSESDEIAHDSESERSRTNSKGKAEKAKSNNYDMFDPAELEVDDNELDDELRNLQAEMNVDKQQELQVPKKGKKTGTRKVSKQTKAKKAKTLSPSPEPESEPVEPPEEEGELDVSVGSTDTVVKKADPEEGPAKKGRGRPAKSSIASQASTKAGDAPAKRGRGRPKKVADTVEAVDSPEPTKPEKEEKEEKEEQQSEIYDEEMDDAEDEIDERQSTPPPAEDESSGDAANAQLLAETLSSPAKVISPAPSARQAALSPSPSPQMSDAENQPPSSVPTASAKSKRLVLAPMAATPTQNSPSKRNKLARLQSTTPWAAIDLDAVIGTPRYGADKENAVSRLLKQGKDLTSPEKGMTVEEWIYFNAGEAEKKLKHECEIMVSQFEREGTRAMNVLEGLNAD